MPFFEYAGTDERGAAVGGELDAAGLVEAASLLRARGVSTSRLERKDPGRGPEPLETADAFAFFNRSLAELAGLGIPLPRAIAEIAAGMRRGRFRDALKNVEARLREGVPFEEAVREHPGVFPAHYAHMLRAGASSGRLPAVLGAVARDADGFRRARQALSNALAYPAVVVMFGLLFGLGFLFAYLPLYEELHARMGLEPSFSLRALLAVFRSWRWKLGLAGGGALAAVLSYVWATRTALGERALFHAPVLGRIRRQLFLARFAGALSILTRSKATLAGAYPVALAASGGREMAASAERLAARAAEGTGLAELLRETPGVPPAAAAYLVLGEKSGRLPDAASELADLLSERAASECETLFLLAMPAALVAAGLLLLGVFAGLVAPYYSFLERIGR